MSDHDKDGMRSRRALGFTLVEVLIVVVILAILAAIAVPQFSNAADDTRRNSIRMSLYRIRTQLEVYREQHDGQMPALATFRDQLTMHTDSQGNTAAAYSPTFRFGPYLLELPQNPHTLTRDVSDDAVGNSAWFYDEATGEFFANDSAETRAY